MAHIRKNSDAHHIYIADIAGRPFNKPRWRYVAQFDDILAADNARKELRAEGFAVEIRYKKFKKRPQ